MNEKMGGTAPLMNNYVSNEKGLPEDKFTVDSGTHWRDPLWACFSYLHLGVILLLAFAIGTRAVNSDAASLNKTQSNEAYDLNADIVIRSLVLAITTGTISSLLMICLLQRMGGAMIKASYYFSIGAKFACSAIFFALGQYAPAALLLLMGLFVLAYYSCIRSRVRFAAVHVEIATLALKGAPDLLLLNVFLLFMQGIWSLIWGLAAVGAEAYVNNSGNPNLVTGGDLPDNGVGGTVMIFLLLLSYFWGSLTIHNLAAFCAASVVGDWWWKGNSEKAPVRGALYRALTTSFGTISFGAFLVAFVRALKSVKNMYENRSGKSGKSGALALIFCVFSIILCILQGIMEWANHWVSVLAIDSFLIYPSTPTPHGAHSHNPPLFHFPRIPGNRDSGTHGVVVSSRRVSGSGVIQEAWLGCNIKPGSYRYGPGRRQSGFSVRGCHRRRPSHVHPGHQPQRNKQECACGNVCTARLFCVHVHGLRANLFNHHGHACRVCGLGPRPCCAGLHTPRTAEGARARLA